MCSSDLRIASHLAADQAFVSARAVKGLICLGYALHPPGKPQQLRTAHLPHLQVPTLIVQGTRDAFGSPAELQPYIAGTAVPVTVHVVEGGDHSFTVRKKDGGDPARVLPDIADTVASWVASVG